ncbi:hypothetical protein [Streptomyces sp. NPDC056105]|uniref:hypothetical protein n=1 Tax=Streptomyces sp. NPDC056105 TaxID=3345714 RepID=UPI0035DE5DF1
MVRHAAVHTAERGPHLAVQLPSACGTVAPGRLDAGSWVGGRPTLHPALDGPPCERGEHRGREQDR